MVGHETCKQRMTLLTKCCFSRFGFVEFNSEEDCKAAREAMEDCKIHGSSVTLYYARPKQEAGRGKGKGE